MMKTTADVIVVGSGAAGMMAAITAAKKGKSCIVLEKGGNIAVSNGARAGGPALANTRLQQEENAVVSETRLFSHMYHFARGTVNGGLLRRAVSRGRKAEQIFAECGIEMTLLPDSYQVGFRARQGFKVSGKRRWQPLADRLCQLGGSIEFNCEATGLERGADGLWKVRVVCKAPEFEQNYFGRVVILATGGYLGNKSMLRKHFGAIHVLPLGNQLSDGKGIEMALAAGGMEDRNWGICANEFSGANHKIAGAAQFSAETRYAVCGGLLVNRQGRRFMNEQFMSDQPLSIGGEMILREGKFYAVLDADMYQRLGEERPYEYYGEPEAWGIGRMNPDPLRARKPGGLERAMESGWAFRGVLSQIAEEAGLPELISTVAEYNRLCALGKDSQYGKAEYLLKPLTKEPFYLFEYEPSAWCTFGGVKTDELCRLIDAKQRVIDGILVAGVDNGSCYCTPYYDNEGAALGIALTTGVLAGETAVDYINGVWLRKED